MSINDDAICNGAQETTYVSAITIVFSFALSSLT